MRALYIGRFQPFHNGHLEVVKNILSEHEELIIAIGSAQESHTPKNPFTAGERFEMIRATIAQEPYDLSKIYMVPVEDVKRNAIWVAHVRSVVPKFDIVYTNEPLTRFLFEEEGYKVQETRLFSRSEFSSTNIRKMILEGKSWDNLVSIPTKRIILKIGGIDRIKRINSNDIK